jgi:hypothetical protein
MLHEECIHTRNVKHTIKCEILNKDVKNFLKCDLDIARFHTF